MKKNMYQWVKKELQIGYGREDGMRVQAISWTKLNQFLEFEDFEYIWAGVKRLSSLAYA